MRYYYDIEQEKYISRHELQKIFERFKADNPCEYNYDFSRFVMNCLTINNGPIQTLYQRKSNLEKLFFTVSLQEFELGLDDTSESESIKQEIDFVNKLIAEEQ